MFGDKATSLVNDPSLRGEGREIQLTLTETLNDGNRVQLEGILRQSTG